MYIKNYFLCILIFLFKITKMSNYFPLFTGTPFKAQIRQLYSASSSAFLVLVSFLLHSKSGFISEQTWHSNFSPLTLFNDMTMKMINALQFRIWEIISILKEILSHWLIFDVIFLRQSPLFLHRSLSYLQMNITKVSEGMKIWWAP